MRLWRVGELADATGLTVRTLHHYDEIGLLTPSGRSDAGYRLYSGDDIGRLQRVVALRQLGLSLDEIGDCLNRPDYSLEQVLDLRMAQLRREIDDKRQLLARLEPIAAHARAKTVTAEELLKAIEAMTMFEKYYTPEQLEQLRVRGEQVGQERIREVEQAWPVLIAKMNAEREKGTDPSDPVVQDLARQWQGLIAEFTGGDPGIRESLGRMYQSETHVQEKAGIPNGLMEYVSQAATAGGIKI